MKPTLIKLVPSATPDEDVVDLQVPSSRDVSEDMIARAFTERHRDDLRFDHDVGRWYEWDGTCWRDERTKKAFDYARQYGRALSGGQRGVCRAAVARGVERFAQADRTHAVTNDIWDQDLWLLGTPAGTVDLRTGLLRPPQREDYISKRTSVVPESGEPGLWVRFIYEVLGGDPDLIRFVQQCFGYCLTGDTREHALFFLYGPGGNGKSVYLNTMRAIMGEYAVAAAVETFTASKYDRHPTELAMLRGARLVTASETEEHRAFAEAKIKALTGGDPITARFMRRDNFTFTPTFKLVIAGNHAPRLRNVDEALRRRLNIVPFDRIPKNPDKDLEKKLVGEHGRILTWAIRGCLDWQESGLLRPGSVAAATSAYFEDQDVLGKWISEHCDVDKSNFTWREAVADLYAAFVRDAAAENLSSIAFGKEMKKRKFEAKTVRLNNAPTKAYTGIRLRRGALDNCDG